MTRKIYKLLASLVLPLFVIMVAGAATSLSPKEARQAVATIPGLEFDPNQVRIKSIDQGSGGAIVEAQFNIAFRLEKENEWKAVEMRLADGRWENIDLIVTAIHNEKIKRTKERMQALALAIDTYRREHGYYPRVRDVVELTDLLAPQYMNRVIRSDLWLNNFQYSSDGATYRLLSLGPDSKAGTGDEITVENGTLK